MNLDDITARVKSIPPIAWVIAAGVVILVVVVKGGGGGGGSATGSGGGSSVGSGGGGGGSDEVISDTGQQIVDLANAIEANTEADAAFREDIADYLKGATPGNGTLPGIPPLSPLPDAAGLQKETLNRLIGDVNILRKQKPAAAKAYRAKHPIPKVESLAQRISRLQAESTALQKAKK